MRRHNDNKVIICYILAGHTDNNFKQKDDEGKTRHTVEVDILKTIRNAMRCRPVIIFTVLFLVVFTLIQFSSRASAADKKPLDSRICIDHPPFSKKYDGDGRSYMNVGLTLPREYYPEGTSVLGTLKGEGLTVKALGYLKVNEDGQVAMYFPLYSYGSYAVNVTDKDGFTLFEQTVEVTAADTMSVCNPLIVAPPLVTVTATPSPSASATPSPSTTPSPSPSASPSQSPSATPSPSPSATPSPSAAHAGGITDDHHTPWWPWLAIPLGVLLVVGGTIMTRPCFKERLAWEAAKRALKQARVVAEKADEAARQAETVRAGLETDLEAVRSTYPSAGKPGGDEAWAESEGLRLTSRDLAMRREEENAAFGEYHENPTPETAASVEDAWKRAADADAVAARRKVDAQIRDLERRLEEARRAEKDARRRAQEAENAARQAGDAADAARRAYAVCMHHAQTPEGKPVGQGGVKIVEDQNHGCECTEGDVLERNKREMDVLAPARIKVFLRGGFAHEQLKIAQEISGIIKTVSEMLDLVKLAMTLQGIGSASLSTVPVGRS